jgi:hypothetical protein
VSAAAFSLMRTVPRKARDPQAVEL